MPISGHPAPKPKSNGLYLAQGELLPKFTSNGLKEFAQDVPFTREWGCDKISHNYRSKNQADWFIEGSMLLRRLCRRIRSLQCSLPHQSILMPFERTDPSHHSGKLNVEGFLYGTPKTRVDNDQEARPFQLPDSTLPNVASAQPGLLILEA